MESTPRKRLAYIDGAWIAVIFANQWIVATGSSRRVAGVDGAAVEVVTGGAGSFQGGGRFSAEDVPQAEQKQDGERGDEADETTGGVGLHEGPP